jgi:ABC-type transport system substrate-binding protein
MTIRKILIITPILVILFLVQSFFWVPTYEEQTRGNPERLNEYITASIGDASILNPILSTDSASSEIESLVFEGLIDRDEELRFRGRVATAWEIFEEAYFYLNTKAAIPGRGSLSAAEVKDLIMGAKEGEGAYGDVVRSSLENIREISVLPPREMTVPVPWEGKDNLVIRAPARIKMVMARVDQDLFKSLTALLGPDYFGAFSPVDYITIQPEKNASTPGRGDGDDQEGKRKKLAAHAPMILPATEHNPVILFHLRPGVRFHDGHALDAQDVKFTYEAIVNPRNLSPRVSDYEPVKEVEVIDPLTVRIVYKRLYSPAIGTWAMGILPEHLLNDEALRQEAARLGKDSERFSMKDSTFSRRPVGCGPFRFREWKADQYISLHRFEDYWEGPPNYRRYLYRIVPDLLTQEMEFYAGTVDSYSVQPHQVQRLKDDPNYQSFSGLSFGYTYIGYNMRREPFKDRRVRKALGMAVDVDKIIRYVLYGQGERITGPFVKQTDYYNHQVRPLPYDPKGALSLLAEAGWEKSQTGWLEKEGKRLQFTLITNSGNDLRKSIMAIVQDAWRQIGVDVRTDLVEWSVFVEERIKKLDFDALILGWSMGIEPDLFQIWHSSQTHAHQLNFVDFKDPEADDLIVKIRQEYDHQRQVAYSHQLHEIIAREQPYTFLYVGKWTAVLDKRIVIKEINDQGAVVYRKITPTKTGSYTFYFNKWIKVPEEPTFGAEG